MSVINQALRDLEKRGAGPSRPNKGAQDRARVNESEANNYDVRLPRSKQWLALAFVVAVAAGFGFYLGVDDSVGLPVKLKERIVNEQTPATTDDQNIVAESSAVELPTASANKSVIESDQVLTKVKNSQSENKVLNATDEHIAKTSSDDLEKNALVSDVKATDQHLEVAASPVSVSDSTENTEEPSLVRTSQRADLRENRIIRSKNGGASETNVAAARTISVVPVSENILARGQDADPVSASPSSIDLTAALAARRKAEVGDLTGARMDLEDFIANNSINDAAQLELAGILVKLQDYEALDSVLEQAQSAQNYFEQAEMRMIAARRWLQKGDPDAAYDALRAALPAIERNPHYYALLASVEQKRGRHLQQIDLYQRLIKTHGDRAKWWLGSAIAWDQLERYDSAQRAYMRAKQLNLSDPSLMAFVDQRLKQLRGQQ